MISDSIGSFVIPQFQYRPLENTDAELMYKWLNEPHVAEHWGGSTSVDKINLNYFSPNKNGNCDRFIACLNDNPVGYIQSYRTAQCEDGWWQEEKDPGTVGIDYFIGQAENLNKGLGTQMIQQFVKMLFTNPAITKIISDPAPNNLRSIRCLEKCGFKQIAPIQTPDGAAILLSTIRDIATGKC